MVALYRVWGEPVAVDTVDSVADHVFRSSTGGSVLGFEVEQSRECRLGRAPRERLLRGWLHADPGPCGGTVADRDRLGLEGPRVEVVVDRLEPRPDRRSRIAEAVETAYRFGGGLLRRPTETTGSASYDSRGGLHCASATARYSPPGTRGCSRPTRPWEPAHDLPGLRAKRRPDMDRIIPDPGLTLAERPVDPWNKPALPPGIYRHLTRRRAARSACAGTCRTATCRPATVELIERGGHGFYGIDGFFRLARVQDRTSSTFGSSWLGTGPTWPCATCSGRA